MKHITLAVLAIITLSACETLGPAHDKVIEKAQEGVDRYCAEVSTELRAETREKFNPTPGGATAVITCP